MKKTLFITLLLAIGLGGCGEKTKTKEYYMQPENAQELEAKVKECKNDPGGVGQAPNCINAIEAMVSKSMKTKDNSSIFD
ncbi:MAG: EexN family lipoprotein [Campylobacterales bacterium]|nr:EexN family lipoprotein [Campylobacterales bacterium]